MSRLGVILAGLALLGAGGGTGPGLGANPVLPAPADHLRFEHRLHADQACQACHPGVDLRPRPAVMATPGHDRCRGCHPEAEAGHPAARSCRACHRGTPRPAERSPALLRFSHAVHSASPQRCRTCHDPAAHRPTAQAERCFGCHADLLADGRCDTCHPARADGRLLLDGPAGRLVPRGGHSGDDHRAGWERNHGHRARQSADSCRACHAQRHCDGCHRGVAKPFAQHPADWELTHATLARGDAHRCAACHRSQSDCLGCHRRAGLGLDDRGPANHRVHPEGFATAGHASEARRNLLACTGCHAEADCIRCHAEPGRGAGVSPHPPGFGRRCRLMRQRNPRPCLKCHSDLDGVCP